jgi:hypothetical protein
MACVAIQRDPKFIRQRSGRTTDFCLDIFFGDQGSHHTFMVAGTKNLHLGAGLETPVHAGGFVHAPGAWRFIRPVHAGKFIGRRLFFPGSRRRATHPKRIAYAKHLIVAPFRIEPHGESAAENLALQRLRRREHEDVEILGIVGHTQIDAIVVGVHREAGPVAGFCVNGNGAVLGRGDELRVPAPDSLKHKEDKTDSEGNAPPECDPGVKHDGLLRTVANSVLVQYMNVVLSNALTLRKFSVKIVKSLSRTADRLRDSGVNDIL